LDASGMIVFCILLKQILSNGTVPCVVVLVRLRIDAEGNVLKILLLL